MIVHFRSPQAKKPLLLMWAERPLLFLVQSALYMVAVLLCSATKSSEFLSNQAKILWA